MGAPASLPAGSGRRLNAPICARAPSQPPREGPIQPHSTPEFQGYHISGRSGQGRGMKSPPSGERPRWPSRPDQYGGEPQLPRERRSAGQQRRPVAERPHCSAGPARGGSARL